MEDFNEAKLIKSLKIDAAGLGIPSGAADVFIAHTVKAVKKSLKTKQIITEKDLERLIAKELKKYNQDLAYVIENYDKII